MLISQTALAKLCLFAFLLGVVFGFFYDLLRITRVLCGAEYGSNKKKRPYDQPLPLIGKAKRQKIKKPWIDILTVIQDFLFCVCASIALIVLFYQENQGNIRVSACLASAFGFVAYRAILGKPIMYASEWIAFGVQVIFRYCLFFILLPLRWLLAQIIRLLKKIVGYLLRCADRRARLRYTKKQALVSERFANRGNVKGNVKGKDGRYAKGKEKLESSDENSSRRHGRRIHRSIHQ